MPHRYPMFHNPTLEAQAVGLALLREERGNHAYYLSTVGPTTAVKGLWASLTSNSRKSALTAPDWSPGTQFKGADDLRTFNAPIPDAPYTHGVFRSLDPNLVLVTLAPGDPDVLAACAADGSLDVELALSPTRTSTSEAMRNRFRVALEPVLLGRFARWLQAHTVFPVLDGWAPLLWDQARNNWRTHGGTSRPMADLQCYGDCLQGFLLDPDWPWFAALEYIHLYVQPLLTPE